MTAAARVLSSQGTAHFPLVPDCFSTASDNASERLNFELLPVVSSAVSHKLLIVTAPFWLKQIQVFVPIQRLRLLLLPDAQSRTHALNFNYMQVDSTSKRHKNMDKINNDKILTRCSVILILPVICCKLYLMSIIYTGKSISFRGGDALVKLVLSKI